MIYFTQAQNAAHNLGHFMTFGYWCIFIAFLLPYFFTILAKAGSHFNNYEPRPFMEKVTGWRKRAYWAHLNSFEAFPPFAAGVIIAHQLHVSMQTLNFLAGLFICSRILYGIFYITNHASIRSLVWLVGFLSIIGLFVAAARV